MVGIDCHSICDEIVDAAIVLACMRPFIFWVDFLRPIAYPGGGEAT